MKPNTKYTRSGQVNIAYQVFGSGAIDLVYIPGWISNIDLMWACPELVHFLKELGKIARVILFDKRGTGLSDRVVEFPTLEERMDDIRAVMDAVDSQKAILFGHSEGGSVSALFAATYPNRTISLIAFGIFAKRIYSPNYPWAPTNEERQKVYDMIENSWGSGDMNLESLAPSKANDSVFMDWLANYFRSGASPSAALMLTKMNTQVDIIDILSSIKVPTLLMQRTNDIDVKIEEGRFIAERIEGAKFIEFEGDDHLFWAGNTLEVLEEMKSFIVDVKPKPVYDRQLYTLILGSFVSAKINDFERFKLTIDNCVKAHNGNTVQYNEETFTVTFNRPSKAIDCSIDLIESVRDLNAQLNIGIDIRECYENHCISKGTETSAKSILKQSQPNQIVLTQTVKNLLIGVSLNFKLHKTIFDVSSRESILLFSVTKGQKHDVRLNGADPNKISQNDSFLENVIQTIDINLSNEYFSVEMLCREIGVSERQLQRKLKEITQKSPNQLISTIRLNLAKELILSTQDTISEIAFKTGFSNPSYFSKCFKKEFGVSPSDLKSQ